MREWKANRTIRVVTLLVSVGYFVLWTAALLLLVVLPVLHFVVDAGSVSTDMSFETRLPVTLSGPDVRLTSSWDAGRTALELKEGRAQLAVPWSVLPRWYWLASLIGSAIGIGLVLGFVHHLRRIFQRACDGAPFDADNAGRLRWMGVLLLGYHLFANAHTYWLSTAIRQTLDASGSITLGSRFEIEQTIVLIALMLIALAEIFRRGAVLEDEQSLLV